MLKTLKFIFAGACGLLAFASCSDDDLEVAPNESYYASLATITSSDSNVTITGNEAEVTFKVEGGTVTFTVDCGCEWKATSYKPEYFTATTTSTSVTITAVQNTVENELAGVVSLMTAGEGIQFARIQVYQNAYGAPEITVSSNEWNAPAVGALTTEISVTASDEWDIENTAEWLTVEKTGTGISLAAAENEETEERVAKVVLTCTDGIRSDSETITVTQDGKAYITLSEESVSFSSDGASATVTVESNFDWDYSYDSSNDWLKVTANGNVLTVTASANDSSDDREATVNLTAGDGAENVTEAQLTILQAGSTSGNMILTYTIAEANTTTQLPLYGTVDCTVDWGDGTVEAITDVEPSHTYAEAGEYDITIIGTVTALYSKNISTSSSHLTALTAVKQWGDTGLNDMQYAFCYCSDLVSLPEEFTAAMRNEVTSFAYTFRDCSSLTELPSFENFSEVTTFTNAFYKCTSLTEAPKFANCPKLTNFSTTFYGCTALKTLPSGMFSGSTGITSLSQAFYNCALESIPSDLFSGFTEVTTFSQTFYECSSLASLPDNLFADCTACSNFGNTFQNCSSLTKVPGNLFPASTTVNTVNFQYCFQNCSELTSIQEGDEPSLFAGVKGSSFTYVFYGCSKLTSVPEDLFSEQTSATTFTYAFYNCSSLTKVPTFSECTSATAFGYLFQGCTSITEVPDGLFNENATTLNYIFSGCTSLKTVPTSLFDNNKKVTNFLGAFQNCSAVQGESPYTEHEVTDAATGETSTIKVHLYERSDYTDLGYSNPSSHNSCFSGSSFSDIDSIPTGWGGTLSN